MEGKTGVIIGVLLVPGLARNLPSVGAMADMGLSVDFCGNQCTIRRKEDTMLKGAKKRGLYTVRLAKVQYSAMMASTRQEEMLCKWHCRFGHGIHDTIKEMKEEGIVHGALEREDKCKECALGKIHRPPFKHRRGITSHRVLELLHIDLCGPMQESSIGGARYLMMTLDDFSRRNFVVPIKQKGDTFEAFKRFETREESFTGE